MHLFASKSTKLSRLRVQYALCLKLQLYWSRSNSLFYPATNYLNCPFTHDEYNLVIFKHSAMAFARLFRRIDSILFAHISLF